MTSTGPRPGHPTEAELADAIERGWLGQLSREKSVGPLKEFMAAGGTVIALESGTSLASFLDLPVRRALVEKDQNGEERPWPKDKFHVPGSLLTAAVEPTHPVAAGLPGNVVLSFDNSPVFDLPADAATKGIRPIVWFDREKSLRSGWAWGEEHLRGKVSAFEATVGQGRLYSFGSDITFRGQADGTYPLLFNSLLLSAARGAD